MSLILIGFVIYFVIECILDRKKKKDEKRVGITNLTDFELKPIEQQDINYDEAVNMFNSSRSMVTSNNRNSSVSMVDPTNRSIMAGNSTINDFQKDKSGLLSSKLKDKNKKEVDQVFGQTLEPNGEYKSGFKETVQLFSEDLVAKKNDGDIKQASNYKTAKGDPI